MSIKYRSVYCVFQKILYRTRRKYGMIPFSNYETDDKQISYYDWWECDPNKEWFTRFIRNNIGNNKKYNSRY